MASSSDTRATLPSEIFRRFERIISGIVGRVGLAKCRTSMLDLDGDMGQVGELGQSLPVMRRLVHPAGCDRDDGAEVSRPKPPKVQVGDAVALAFDHLADSLRHARIRRAIEQDAAGIAQQPDRPVGDDERADEAGQRVHPEPTERARQQQSDNDQNRYRGIGQNVNDGGPHIVVAVMRAVPVAVIVFLESQFAVMPFACLQQLDPGKKGMRFRNFIAGFQISAAVLERK